MTDVHTGRPNHARRADRPLFTRRRNYRRSASEDGDHGGGVGISFLLNHTPPGRVVSDHRHPDGEVFILLDGEAPFRVDGAEASAHGGQVVVAPAGAMYWEVPATEKGDARDDLHPRGGRDGHPAGRLNERAVRLTSASPTTRGPAVRGSPTPGTPSAATVRGRRLRGGHAVGRRPPDPGGAGQRPDSRCSRRTACSRSSGAALRARPPRHDGDGGDVPAAALLVKAAPTLDVLSGGRAWLGLGAGYHPGGGDWLGLPLPPTRERFDRLEETLEIPVRMWAGDATPSRAPLPAGAAGQAARAAPRPHLPILIGGRGAAHLPLVARTPTRATCSTPDGGQTVRHKLAVLGYVRGRGPTLAAMEKTLSSRLAPGGRRTRSSSAARAWQRSASSTWC